jgi:hypothetical protein
MAGLERWPRALEKLLGWLGLLTEEEIDVRWWAADLATPHGHEVLLGNAG